MTHRSTAAQRRLGRRVLGVAILAIGGIVTACAPAATVAPSATGIASTPSVSASPAAAVTAGPPAEPGVITLVTPAADAVIVQNDPALATQCPANATAGRGYDIEFSWTSTVTGVDHFEVVMQHRTSTPIVLEVAGATTTTLSALSCGTFVIDNNVTGWHWQVNALNSGKQVLATSAQRAFTFGPCRVAGGATCSSP